MRRTAAVLLRSRGRSWLKTAARAAAGRSSRGNAPASELSAVSWGLQVSGSLLLDFSLLAAFGDTEGGCADSLCVCLSVSGSCEVSVMSRSGVRPRMPLFLCSLAARLTSMAKLSWAEGALR